jgi:hypothetical protein
MIIAMALLLSAFPLLLLLATANYYTDRERIFRSLAIRYNLQRTSFSGSIDKRTLEVLQGAQLARALSGTVGQKHVFVADYYKPLMLRSYLARYPKSLLIPSTFTGAHSILVIDGQKQVVASLFRLSPFYSELEITSVLDSLNSRQLPVI